MDFVKTNTSLYEGVNVISSNALWLEILLVFLRKIKLPTLFQTPTERTEKYDNPCDNHIARLVECLGTEAVKRGRMKDFGCSSHPSAGGSVKRFG